MHDGSLFKKHAWLHFHRVDWYVSPKRTANERCTSPLPTSAAILMNIKIYTVQEMTIDRHMPAFGPDLFEADLLYLHVGMQTFYMDICDVRVRMQWSCMHGLD